MRAVQWGGRIGVICTTQTTFLPSQNLIRQHADRLGRNANALARLESAACEAVMAGDKARHDELVKQVPAVRSRECDVAVLAQAAVAHLAPELNESLVNCLFCPGPICALKPWPIT